MDGAAQVEAYVLYTLCIPRWPSNLVVSFPKVAQAMEVAFCLKENPKPSNFISEASLRDFGLTFVGAPPVAFTASPSIIVPFPASETPIEVT